MKVYIKPPFDSRGINRVVDALFVHHPAEVEIVNSVDEADLVVVHVIGRRDHIERQCADLVKKGKKYAIIQYCVRSTLNISCMDWIGIWAGAEVVWSYYDLKAMFAQDAVTPGLEDDFSDRFNFYHSPLGVDEEIFHSRGHKRTFIIGTCSPDALVEGVRECAIAADRVGKKMFHLGGKLDRGDHILSKTGIEDIDVADMFGRCEFVSGLRRKEGFEFPAAEGLLCGARPLLFDQPHYRQWYGDMAVYIPELPREEVVEALVRLFEAGAEPVTQAEIKRAQNLFNWSTILEGFWSKIL